MESKSLAAGAIAEFVAEHACRCAENTSARSCVARGDRVFATADRIDLLVNNAGVSFYGALEKVSTEQARAVFETNFFGVLRMTRAVLPFMREQGRGRIGHSGSVAGFMPMPFRGISSTSKYALEGYSDPAQPGSPRFGIRVSVIHPSFIRTNIDRSMSTRKTMTTDQTFSVTRHSLTTEKPLDAVISELEKRSPVVPPEVFGQLADLNLPQDQLKARVEGLIGSSGFVFFLKVRHDQLFSRFGRTHASVQYAIGNPLIAKDVSDKAPAICLYTPFRLAVYESPETHETIVSYDSPASLFGSFGVPEAAEIGAKLEEKLQDLLTRCL